MCASVQVRRMDPHGLFCRPFPWVVDLLRREQMCVDQPQVKSFQFFARLQKGKYPHFATLVGFNKIQAHFCLETSKGQQML